MVNVAYEIERLVKFAVRKKMITVWDIIPVRNSLMAVLNSSAAAPPKLML